MLDLVVGAVLVTCAVLVRDHDAHRPAAAAAVAGVLWMSTIALRSAHPFAMGVLAALGAVAYALTPGSGIPTWSLAGTLVVCFSVGSRLGGRHRAVALALLVVAGLTLATARSDESGVASHVVAPLVITLAPALASGLLRRSRLQAAQLRRMADELVAQRQAHARDAAAAERNRIARELHDVISHAVGEMVVQAGAADLLLEGDSPARQAVAVVRSTGREALAELRSQLGALRADDGRFGAPDSVPSLADLPRIAGSSGARLQVDPTVRLDAFPPGQSLAAFRVAQEALTNARKHAVGAAVTIDVRRTPLALVVTVSNGPGAPLPDTVGGGHGLPGMRERVAMYGGDLDAGAAPNGGWCVAARFPLAASAAVLEQGVR